MDVESLDKKMCVLADRDVVTGFKLAGIKASFEYDESNIEAQVDKVASYIIVIVTEEVAAKLREKHLAEKIAGTLVEIPGKSGSTGKAQERISALFESAIGVKLQGN